MFNLRLLFLVVVLVALPHHFASVTAVSEVTDPNASGVNQNGLSLSSPETFVSDLTYHPTKLIDIYDLYTAVLNDKGDLSNNIVKFLFPTLESNFDDFLETNRNLTPVLLAATQSFETPDVFVHYLGEYLRMTLTVFADPSLVHGDNVDYDISVLTLLDLTDKIQLKKEILEIIVQTELVYQLGVTSQHRQQIVNLIDESLNTVVTTHSYESSEVALASAHQARRLAIQSTTIPALVSVFANLNLSNDLNTVLNMGKASPKLWSICATIQYISDYASKAVVEATNLDTPTLNLRSIIAGLSGGLHRLTTVAQQLFMSKTHALSVPSHHAVNTLSAVRTTSPGRNTATSGVRMRTLTPGAGGCSLEQKRQIEDANLALEDIQLHLEETTQRFDTAASSSDLRLRSSPEITTVESRRSSVISSQSSHSLSNINLEFNDGRSPRGSISTNPVTNLLVRTASIVGRGSISEDNVRLVDESVTLQDKAYKIFRRGTLADINAEAIPLLQQIRNRINSLKNSKDATVQELGVQLEKSNAHLERAEYAVETVEHVESLAGYAGSAAAVAGALNDAFSLRDAIEVGDTREIVVTSFHLGADAAIFIAEATATAIGRSVAAGLGVIVSTVDLILAIESGNEEAIITSSVLLSLSVIILGLITLGNVVGVAIAALLSLGIAFYALSQLIKQYVLKPLISGLEYIGYKIEDYIVSTFHGSNPCYDTMTCQAIQAGGYRCPSGQIYVEGTCHTPCHCEQCPLGTWALSSTKCFPCPAGTKCPNAQNLPIICLPGTYQSKIGQIDCSGISQPGYYTPTNNTIAFLVGVLLTTNGGGGAVQQLPCPVGTYNNAAQMAWCLPCPGGTYSNVIGATSCQICPAGFYCFPDGINSIGATVPIPCPVGSVSGNGYERCSSCPIDTYQPQNGQNDCISCPLGSYSTKGATSCLRCPQGQYGVSYGVVSEKLVTVYNSATGLPISNSFSYTGHVFCASCPAGSYQDRTGETACKACVPGSYSADGAVECTPCDVGSYSSFDSAVCLQCPDGTYQGNTGGSTCENCPVGTASSNSGIGAGASKCSSCIPGTYSNVPGTIKCSKCFPGSYQPKIGASSCLACPVGTYDSLGGGGSTQCTLCPSGTYGNVTGSTVCTNCTAGYYSSQGATTCSVCPGVGTSAAGASQCCQAPYIANSQGSCVCPAGMITQIDVNTGKGGCFLVPAGFYSTIDQPLHTDRACPVGTYSSLPGATSCTSCPANSIPIPGITNATSLAKACSCQLNFYLGIGGCQPCYSPYTTDNSSSSICSCNTTASQQGLCTVGSTWPPTSTLSCSAGQRTLYHSTSSTSAPLNPFCGTMCPTGTYTTIINTLSVCTPCQQGQYSFPGATACSTCAPGTGITPGPLSDSPIIISQFGGSTSYQHAGHAFDGDFTTYYASPSTNDVWVGLRWSPTLPVYSAHYAPQPWQYIGCYNDDLTKPALSIATYTGGYNISGCFQLAVQNNAKYFGLQNAGAFTNGSALCYIGTSNFGIYGNATTCSTTDISGNILGGSSSNAVYTLDFSFLRPWSYVGCYSDNTTIRALTATGSNNNNNGYDVTGCGQLARDLGYKYFGLQNAGDFQGKNIGQCFLGRTGYDMYGNTTSTCQYTDSAGNKLGGSLSNAVYVVSNITGIKLSAMAGGQFQVVDTTTNMDLTLDQNIDVKQISIIDTLNPLQWNVAFLTYPPAFTTTSPKSMYTYVAPSGSNGAVAELQWLHLVTFASNGDPMSANVFDGDLTTSFELPLISTTIVNVNVSNTFVTTNTPDGTNSVTTVTNSTTTNFNSGSDATIVLTSVSTVTLTSTVSGVTNTTVTTTTTTTTTQSSVQYVGVNFLDNVVLSSISYSLSASKACYSPTNSSWMNPWIGGTFQLSNSSSFLPNDTVTVIRFVSNTDYTTAGTWVTVPMPADAYARSPTGYQYARYVIGPGLGSGTATLCMADIQFSDFPISMPVVIGTKGSYNGNGNTLGNVFDGDATTSFEAPFASGAWVGWDLKVEMAYTKIGFLAKPTRENLMVGGRFEASTSRDFSSSVVTLYTITSPPKSTSSCGCTPFTLCNMNISSITCSAWNNVTITPPLTQGYRYYRYIGPDNGWCNIAEFQLSGAVPLGSLTSAGNNLSGEGSCVICQPGQYSLNGVCQYVPAGTFTYYAGATNYTALAKGPSSRQILSIYANQPYQSGWAQLNLYPYLTYPSGQSDRTFTAWVFIESTTVGINTDGTSLTTQPLATILGFGNKCVSPPCQSGIGDYTGDEFAFGLYLPPTGPHGVSFVSGTASGVTYSVNSTFQFIPRTWNHITVIVSKLGKQVTILINGTQATALVNSYGTININTISRIASIMHIGHRPLAGPYQSMFPGSITNVNIYKSVLDYEQIILDLNGVFTSVLKPVGSWNMTVDTDWGDLQDSVYSSITASLYGYAQANMPSSNIYLSPVQTRFIELDQTNAASYAIVQNLSLMADLPVGNSDRSYMMWFKIIDYSIIDTNVPVQTQATLLSFSDGLSTCNTGIELSLGINYNSKNGNDNIWWKSCDGSTTLFRPNPGFNFIPTQWYHVAVGISLQGSSIRVYLNGTQTSSVSTFNPVMMSNTPPKLDYLTLHFGHDASKPTYLQTEQSKLTNLCLDSNGGMTFPVYLTCDSTKQISQQWILDTKNGFLYTPESWNLQMCLHSGDLKTDVSFKSCDINVPNQRWLLDKLLHANAIVTGLDLCYNGGMRLVFCNSADSSQRLTHSDPTAFSGRLTEIHVYNADMPQKYVLQDMAGYQNIPNLVSAWNMNVDYQGYLYDSVNWVFTNISNNVGTGIYAVLTGESFSELMSLLETPATCSVGQAVTYDGSCEVCAEGSFSIIAGTNTFCSAVPLSPFQPFYVETGSINGGSYVSIQNLSAITTGNFLSSFPAGTMERTITGWFYLDKTLGLNSGQQNATIFSYNAIDTTCKPGIELALIVHYNSAANSIELTSCNLGSIFFAPNVTSFDFQTNKWYHFAIIITQSGNGVELYLNNEFVPFMNGNTQTSLPLLSTFPIFSTSESKTNTKNLCLDSTGAVPGSSPLFAPCNTLNPHQQWIIDNSTGYLQTTQTIFDAYNLCLDSNNATVGSSPIFSSCNYNSKDKQWKLNVTNSLFSVSSNQSNLCLDSTGSTIGSSPVFRECSLQCHLTFDLSTGSYEEIITCLPIASQYWSLKLDTFMEIGHRTTDTVDTNVFPGRITGINIYNSALHLIHIGWDMNTILYAPSLTNQFNMVLNYKGQILDSSNWYYTLDGSGFGVYATFVGTPKVKAITHFFLSSVSQSQTESVSVTVTPLQSYYLITGSTGNSNAYATVKNLGTSNWPTGSNDYTYATWFRIDQSLSSSVGQSAIYNQTYLNANQTYTSFNQTYNTLNQSLAQLFGSGTCADSNELALSIQYNTIDESDRFILSNCISQTVFKPLGPFNFVLDQWYHVAVAVSSGGQVIHIYLNGAVLPLYGKFTPILINGNVPLSNIPFQIGHRPSDTSNANIFPGRFTGFHVYNTELKQGQVIDDMNNIVASSIVSRFDMNVDSNNNLVDSLPTGIYATLTDFSNIIQTNIYSLVCPPGQYISPFVSKCIPCPSGTHSQYEVVPYSCSICPYGQYSGIGSTSCSSCPSGTSSSFPTLSPSPVLIGGINNDQQQLQMEEADQGGNLCGGNLKNIGNGNTAANVFDNDPNTFWDAYNYGNSFPTFVGYDWISNWPTTYVEYMTRQDGSTLCTYPVSKLKSFDTLQRELTPSLLSSSRISTFTSQMADISSDNNKIQETIYTLSQFRQGFSDLSLRFNCHQCPTNYMFSDNVPQECYKISTSSPCYGYGLFSGIGYYTEYYHDGDYLSLYNSVSRLVDTMQRLQYPIPSKFIAQILELSPSLSLAQLGSLQPTIDSISSQFNTIYSYSHVGFGILQYFLPEFSVILRSFDGDANTRLVSILDSITVPLSQLPILDLTPITTFNFGEIPYVSSISELAILPSVLPIIRKLMSINTTYPSSLDQLGYFVQNTLYTIGDAFRTLSSTLMSALAFPSFDTSLIPLLISPISQICIAISTISAGFIAIFEIPSSLGNNITSISNELLSLPTVHADSMLKANGIFLNDIQSIADLSITLGRQLGFSPEQMSNFNLTLTVATQNRAPPPYSILPQAINQIIYILSVSVFPPMTASLSTLSQQLISASVTLANLNVIQSFTEITSILTPSTTSNILQNLISVSSNIGSLSSLLYPFMMTISLSTLSSSLSSFGSVSNDLVIRLSSEGGYNISPFRTYLPLLSDIASKLSALASALSTITPVSSLSSSFGTFISSFSTLSFSFSDVSMLDHQFINLLSQLTNLLSQISSLVSQLAPMSLSPLPDNKVYNYLSSLQDYYTSFLNLLSEPSISFLNTQYQLNPVSGRMDMVNDNTPFSFEKLSVTSNTQVSSLQGLSLSVNTLQAEITLKSLSVDISSSFNTSSLSLLASSLQSLGNNISSLASSTGALGKSLSTFSGTDYALVFSNPSLQSLLTDDLFGFTLKSILTDSFPTSFGSLASSLSTLRSQLSTVLAVSIPCYQLLFSPVSSEFIGGDNIGLDILNQNVQSYPYTTVTQTSLLPFVDIYNKDSVIGTLPKKLDMSSPLMNYQTLDKQVISRYNLIAVPPGQSGGELAELRFRLFTPFGYSVNRKIQYQSIFDGNFDTPRASDISSSNDYEGAMDYGIPVIHTSIKFAPVRGRESSAVGNFFMASNYPPGLSNSGTSFPAVAIYLAKITTVPIAGQWNYLPINPEVYGTSQGYRFYWYYGSFAIAELQFSDIPLSLPSPLGTFGSSACQSTISRAFDGDTNTGYIGSNSNGQWVGWNFYTPMRYTGVTFTPITTYESNMIGGKFQASNDITFSADKTVTVAIIKSTSPSPLLTSALSSLSSLKVSIPSTLNTISELSRLSTNMATDSTNVISALNEIYSGIATSNNVNVNDGLSKFQAVLASMATDIGILANVLQALPLPLTSLSSLLTSLSSPSLTLTSSLQTSFTSLSQSLSLQFPIMAGAFGSLVASLASLASQFNLLTQSVSSFSLESLSFSKINSHFAALGVQFNFLSTQSYNVSALITSLSLSSSILSPTSPFQTDLNFLKSDISALSSSSSLLQAITNTPAFSLPLSQLSTSLQSLSVEGSAFASLLPATTLNSFTSLVLSQPRTLTWPADILTDAYQYWRYQSPDGSSGAIAEFQFINPIATGSGSCISCPPGQYSSGSGQFCVPCPKGYYCPKPGTVTPIKCPAFTITTTSGLSYCDACIDNYYPTTVTTGSFPQCLACPANSVQLKSSISGTNLGVRNCQCNPGYYLSSPDPYNGLGAGVCTACNKGTITAGGGSFSSGGTNTQCQSCGLAIKGDTSSNNLFYISGSSGTSKDCIYTQSPQGQYSIPGTDLVVTCPAGTYNIYAGQSSCSRCAAGSYSGAVGSTTPCGLLCPVGTHGNSNGYALSGIVEDASCSPCGEGTYIGQTGQASCKSCPAGTYTVGRGSTAATDCLTCPLGTSITSNGGTFGCAKCAPGTHANVTGLSGLCPYCPDGTVSQEGAINCTPCTPGTYSPGPEYTYTRCNLCRPGTFTDTIGAAYCQECPSGQIANSNRTGCIFCPPGQIPGSSDGASYDYCRVCFEGEYAQPGFSQCLPCRAGQYSTSGSSTCLDCQPGTAGYVHYEGQLSGQHGICQTCLQGQYAPNPGMYECLICPLGKLSLNLGSTSCTQCPPGTATYVGGDTYREGTCTQCPPGETNTSDSSTCVSCPYGTTGAHGGLCQGCPAGKSSSENGDGTCVDCYPGRFAPVSGSVQCTSCPDGQVTNGAGKSTCVPCPPGNYSIYGEVCAPCPYHTYSLGGTNYCRSCINGQTSSPSRDSCVSPPPGNVPCGYNEVSSPSGDSCISAPPGSVVSPNQHSFIPCPAGTFSTIDGICRDCSSGTYSSSSGTAICSVCSAGTTSTQGATYCVPCQPGEYSSPGSGYCGTCPRGTQSTGGGCINCQAGYNTDNSTKLCVPCPSGTFNPNAGSPNCATCNPGLYSPTPGATVCTDCPSGTSSGWGASSCGACPAGTYNNLPDSFTCYTCPDGTFSNTSGTTECSNCAAGTHSVPLTGSNGEPLGARYCIPCSAGTYSTVKSSSCSTCAGGQFSGSGASQCSTCPGGTYTPNSPFGYGTCVPCDAGKFSTPGLSACLDCPYSTFSASGQDSCTPCPPGTTSDVGSPSCQGCSPGKYNTGGGHCYECPVGTHNNQTGATTCVDCEPGSVGINLGWINCVKCPPGTSSSQPRSSYCFPCLPGTYAAQEGSTECLPCPYNTVATNTRDGCRQCPAGQYADTSSGGRSCLSCPYGQFSLAGSIQCTPCPDGTHSSGGSSSCTNCTAGQYSSPASAGCYPTPPGSYSNSGASRPTLCPLGSISKAGASSCTSCLAGTYALGGTNTICFNCSPGKFSSSAGATGCDSCSLGSIAPTSGLTTCTTCPAGTHTNTAGALTKCFDCPSGTFSNPGAHDCSFCNAGTYSLGKSPNCTQCPAGSYTDSYGRSGCAPCPATTYSNELGRSACISCSIGTTSYGGAINCTQCPAGTYGDNNGGYAGGKCLLCPAGKTSIPGRSSDYQCTSCLPGTYSTNPGSATCSPCLVGQFSSTSASTTCTPCPPGQFTVVNGSSSCTPCSPGQFSFFASSSSCSNCIPGYYTPSSGYASCSPCPVGTYTSSNSSATCTKCIAGTYSLSQAQTNSSTCAVCPAGYNSSEGASSCNKCPLGYVSSAGSATCTPCLSGTYAPSLASTVCSPCPVGTFSSGGAPTCIPCFTGRYTATNGSTTCSPCAAGTYSGTPGASICTPCNPGTFSNTSANICTSCSLGSYSSSSGSTSCQSCPAGNYTSALASTICSQCGTGNYSSAGASSCNQCSIGTSSSAVGATSVNTCVTCTPGTVTVFAGSSSCIPCPAGAYSMNTSVCSVCPGGTASSTVGAASNATCTLCPAGFASSFAASTCSQCGANTYSNSSGSSSCTTCPIGSYSPTLGATSASTCGQCIPGYYASSSVGCTPCSPGSYSNSSSSNCTLCPVGTFGAESGATNITTCSPCSTGLYSTSGASSCGQCSTGTYVSAPGVCAQCPIGTYNGVNSTASNPVTSCSLCRVGTYASTTGLSSCTSCPLGTYNRNNGSISVNACVACSAGYSNQNPTVPCSPCAPGSYSGATGASSCTLCPLGNATALNGSISCPQCPVGRWSYTAGPSPLPGATRCEDCLFAGYVMSVVGAYTDQGCHPCYAGGTYARRGDSTCSQCLPGTSSYSGPTDQCYPNSPGFYSGFGARQQSTCPDGTFNNVSGSADCTRCSPGTYSLGTTLYTGATVCTQCSPGQYQDGSSATTCKNCPVSTFSSTPGVSTCTTCPDGRYTSTEGNTVCGLCPAGSYCLSGSINPCPNGQYSLGGTSNCTLCPAGSQCGQGSPSPQNCSVGYYSSVPGTGIGGCQVCPVGTSSLPGSTGCTQCAAGTYKTLSSGGSCDVCPAGSFCPTGSVTPQLCSGGTSSPAQSASQGACVNCPAGSTSTAGSLCTACGTGQYNNVAGTAGCNSCPVGSYTNRTGTINCPLCPAGSYNNLPGQTACTTCGPQQYCPTTGMTLPSKCPAGTFIAGTTKPCQSCDIGSYSGYQGACTPCDFGYYCPVVGLSAPVSCPAGTYADITGLSVCRNCPIGKYQFSLGQTSCRLADPGYYVNSTGQSTQKACSPGTYTSSTGLTSCAACPVGTYNFGDQTQCVPCDAGTYSNITGQSTCAYCSAGTYAPSKGYTNCIPCSPGTAISSGGSNICNTCGLGTYTSLPGQTDCSYCSPGTYSNAPGQSSCSLCAAGTSRAYPGSSGCSPCGIGQYSVAGQSDCSYCAAGTFNNQQGQGSCTSCPVGKYTDGPGRTMCTPCVAGSYNNQTNQISCPYCNAGSYNTQVGQSACALCDPGTYQRSIGRTTCDSCGGPTTPSPGGVSCP
jgi:hypothetical protein